MKVLQFPLSKVTLFFIAGIVTGHFAEPSLRILFAFLLFFAVGFALSFYWTQRHPKFNRIFGVHVFAVSFIIGLLTLALHNAAFQKKHYIHLIQNSEQEHEFEIVLRERLRSSIRNERYIALVKMLDGKICLGRILVNFSKDKSDNILPIGTNLKVSGKITLAKKPQNPDQFDYGRYLANKSILAQLYVREKQFQISRNTTKDLFYYSDVLRRKILENLEAAHFPKTELAVIAALILGQQQDLSQEVLQDYQYAGAIHILSVSGLHVGFIVLFLNFVLAYLPKTKTASYFKLALILCSLWAFAVLSGLSPSVIRSVTMFSFVAVGMHLRRKTNVFHTLLVSLLLILLFEPSFLFDVGFQLSYLALFFILWLQPVFSGLWTPKFKIVNYFWQILTVSFAAQIGTLPLSLYHFHQFPGLFSVTNLVIIPFVSFIMASGLLLMLFSAFNCVPGFLLFVVEWSIILLNKIIAWIASFEQFIFQDIPFNVWMLLSLYLVIIGSTIVCVTSDFKRIGFALSALILFQASYFSAKWNGRYQKEWIVFNVSRSTMVVERNGEVVTVYSNQPKKKLLKPYLIANFCHVSNVLPLKRKMIYNSRKILLIDSMAAYPKKTRPDILLLRQSPKFNLERMLTQCKPKQIVADASNFKSYVKRWKATCAKRKIPFHATAEKGFYKLGN
jgi:competence protein ComEC